jgi:3alpha(or 20beta)-hydroxysteroid dehydrogenase
MDRLNGKVAIVTGAAQGMGEAHARAMVAEGAKVMLADIKEAAGAELARELGPAARFVAHDVTDAASWQRLVAATEAGFGNVSVLVNNAGIFLSAAIDDLTIERYRRIIEVNQIGPFLGIKAVIASMRRAGGGSIINISSIGGLVGAPRAMGYCDAKFALRGMSKVAAIELGPDRIRVNTVHPGAIKTPMTMGDPNFRLHYEAASLATPLKRLAEADEVAKLIVFLASDESSFSTGAEFIVDGGMTAQ